MSAGRAGIGWIGLDVPVEIVAAVGDPVRLDADASRPAPDAAPFGEGGGHPWMRAVAAELLARTPTLGRVVIGATPVTGAWLYNFLLTLARGEGAPPLPSLDLVVLSHGDRPSARAFDRASFRRLAERLGAADDAIRKASADRNAVRAAQRGVDALRHGPAPRLLGSKARTLLDAADRMSAQDYLALAEREIAAAQAAPALRDLVPVIYSGPGSPSVELYEALEDKGVCVVGDDADYGSRAIGPDTDSSDDPIAALADRYAHRSPAPAGWTTRARAEWLTGLTAQRGARAVIFDMPPWAHPAAWDSPVEQRALQSRGVACVVAPEATPSHQAEAVAQALRSLGPASAAHA